MIAYITGSGFYEMPGFEEVCVATPYGDVSLYQGARSGSPFFVLPRHGAGHRFLPHQINHRAHLHALKAAGASAVISCSVCGVINPDWPIGQPMVADDLYFPDNRLGDGTACTLFDTPGEAGRGHLLAATFFHPGWRQAVGRALGAVHTGTYAHVTGPRFNSVGEIRALRQTGADFLSQTCGPEAVLANELELPCALAAFGIDYANGVRPTPTPVEVLNENLAAAKSAFLQLMDTLEAPESDGGFQNFIYRFS